MAEHEQVPILKVRDLRVYYETPKGDVLAVDGIDFDLYSGETLGLVGESGSGKSTAAMGILQLVTPPGRIVDGEVILEGHNILGLPDEALRDVRWAKLALIPQGAMNSLNPTMRVSSQIKDVIAAHEGRKTEEEMRTRINELLTMVGLPGRVYDLYPHELSGGMKQRVCIAMAIALNPTDHYRRRVNERARCGGAADRRANDAQGQADAGCLDDYDRSRYGADGADGGSHRRYVCRENC